MKNQTHLQAKTWKIPQYKHSVGAKQWGNCYKRDFVRTEELRNCYKHEGIS